MSSFASDVCDLNADDGDNKEGEMPPQLPA